MTRNRDLHGALDLARDRYAAANPASAAMHERACGPMPGGNTRTTLHFDPFPLVIERGEGSRVTDADGHEYIDFIGEYTAGLYGHSHPVIRAAIDAALDNGVLLCGANTHEIQLSEQLCERFPSVERVRFTNSGTEANLMLVSAARYFTGRTGVMAFNGGYHGGVFYFANGVSPINAPFPYVLGDYNDIDATTATIEANAEELAVVLIEPVMGTAGALPAEAEFLTALRDVTRRHGILLVFDEVMTSRLAPGGAQELYGVIPDLTSFGKYIGGGLTFGAFGGRADVMDLFDPRKPDHLPHSGTFNNNVLTMAAGAAGLRDVYTPEVAIAHNARGDVFRERLIAIAAHEGAPAQVTGRGSLMGFHFCYGPIERPADAGRTPPEARALFHLEMIERGFYLGKSGLSSLSLPLDDSDYNQFADAFADFLATHKSILHDALATRGT
jgi:glutamate-1-semialdehyde 2,1-aminomutase